MGVFTAMILFLLAAPLTGETDRRVMGELDVLRRSYPDLVFEAEYDDALKDWRLLVTSGGVRSELIRAEGRYIPESLMDRREDYRQLIYPFPEGAWDPAGITPEMLERVSRFGSTENRLTAPVSPTALYDIIYDSRTREEVETHIRSISFLGMTLRVHERILGNLARVEGKIRSAAQSDPAVSQFTEELGSGGGYSWRQISDTRGRSFHSMGLAVDLLPGDSRGKSIYWLWEKNGGNDRWMLLPLEDRWMPPDRVVEIFEEEGFIWGGKWPVWDNMHFEYRPELILGRELFDSPSP